MRFSKCISVLLLPLALALPARTQEIGGTIFEDRNANGIHDPGEPPLAGVPVRLFGTAAGNAVDQQASSAADGTYGFSPGDGCYLVAPDDPPGWRLSRSRGDAYPDTTPGYLFPVGLPRFSKLDQVVTNLQSGSYTLASIGDSIAWNFNICGYPESFWYSKQIRSRLACVAPSVGVTLNQAAIKGEHTDDLLVDETGETNNVFRLFDLQPDLVTISIIGNDLLNVDPGSSPTQQAINRAVAEVLDARQNLQEALSSLLSEIPTLDIALNTLYDNEAYNCYTGAPGSFHRSWIPIVNRILRDLAWGQSRRVAINEVAAEFAHEDQLGDCTGFDEMICRDLFQFDLIHPTNDGFTIIREKVWEGIGGINLGIGDALGRRSVEDADYGYLRHLRRLSPRTWEVRDGAEVIDPAAALDGEDAGAPAEIRLGAGTEELRLSGFPDWFDEIRIVRVIAGVRYRTSGTVGDDFYRMEASLDGTFRPPPGFAYTPTRWNFFTPIVGGGGPNRPSENPDYASARVLALPDVAVYRSASATLSKDPVLSLGASDYEWPAVTHEELATTTLRIATASVAGTPANDAYTIELDHAWLDLYGWEAPRPDEVAALRLYRTGDGTLELSFDPLLGAQRYNLYAGTLASLRSGIYDHGTGAWEGPECAATTHPDAGSRLKILRDPGQQGEESAYYLVTAHVDDVESPAGYASNATEIDRSHSLCR